LPKEMKQVPQWHLWRMEDGRKIPYQIDGVQKAKSNDPATWSFYEDAVQAASDMADDGFNLAFTLGVSGQFVGIDADDAFDGDFLKPWAYKLWNAVRERSYAEVSPSGTGFKCILVGQKPDGMRCVYKQDGGQIEVYDNARFWAITGEEIEPFTGIDGSIGRFADCDFGGIFDSQPVPAPSSSKIVPIEPYRDDWFREQTFLEATGVPTSDRNNSTFRVAGHIASFGRGVEETIEFLRPWFERMPQQPTPFSYEEFERTVRSAFVNGTPRGDKGQSTSTYGQEIVVLDGLEVFEEQEEVEEATPVVQKKPSDPSWQIPECVFRDGGFIEKWIDWCSSSMRRHQPELALAGALHTLSLALSRTYMDDSSYETMPNLYTVAVGRSGCGKDTPRKKVIEFLKLAGHSDLNGPAVLDSSAGLAARLVNHPSTGLLLDEIGEVFAMLGDSRTPQHFKKLATMLKQMFSDSGKIGVQPRMLASDDNKQNDPVDYPHLHIMGTATPEKMLRGVTDDQIEDGLMGRFMLFFACDTPQKKSVTKSQAPHGLIEHFKRYRGDITETSITDDLLSDVGGSPITHIKQIRRTPEAESRLEQHYDDIYDKNDSDYLKGNQNTRVNVWNRVAEKTAKLALLFAASRCPDPRTCEITIEDANRAILLSNMLANRVVAAYNERCASEYEEQLDFVYSQIPSSWITEAALHHAARRVNPVLRERIINDLLRSGRISKAVKGSKFMYSNLTDRDL